MKKTLLLLDNGFELYEASVFTDVLDWNMEEGDGTTPIVTCGLRKTLGLHRRINCNSRASRLCSRRVRV